MQIGLQISCEINLQKVLFAVLIKVCFVVIEKRVENMLNKTVIEEFASSQHILQQGPDDTITS